METAAIYARVSTDEQKKHGISLDAQIARCEMYAKDMGFEVIDRRSEGLSGKDTNRPEFQQILTLVAKKKVQHVLVVKWDRVSRDDDNYVGILRKLFVKNDVKLHLTTEGGFIDLTDDAAVFMLKMRANLAWFERRRISSNTKFGMARKRDKGERISRQAPYGYRFEDGKVVVCPEEQVVITKIRQLMAEGYSERKVIAALADEGLFNREGHPFTRGTIRTVMAKAA